MTKCELWYCEITPEDMSDGGYAILIFAESESEAENLARPYYEEHNGCLDGFDVLLWKRGVPENDFFHEYHKETEKPCVILEPVGCKICDRFGGVTIYEEPLICDQCRDALEHELDEDDIEYIENRRWHVLYDEKEPTAMFRSQDEAIVYAEKMGLLHDECMGYIDIEKIKSNKCMGYIDISKTKRKETDND